MSTRPTGPEPESATGAKVGPVETGRSPEAVSAARGRFAGRYAKTVLVTLLTITAVSLAGYLPMARIAGADGPAALLAGSLIVLMSASLAALVGCQDVGPGAAAINRVLLATAIRMAVALALCLAAALSGWWPKPPLLIWVAVVYLVTLLVDTVLLTRSLADGLPADHSRPAEQTAPRE